MKDRQEFPHSVVLLHGIGLSSWMMLYTKWVLKRAGYKTYNFAYPSTKYNIKGLTNWLARKCEKEKVWENSSKVSFVAHSLGGLLTGFYLDSYRDSLPQDKMGRVVMMGTPHGGSEVADYLKDNSLFKWYFGPAGQELTTTARAQQKVEPWYDLGMIAGSSSWPTGKRLIKEPHDGVVSINSTIIANLKDHLTVPVTHSLFMWTPSVVRQVLYFLKHGKFSKQNR